ncbi:MAG: transposase [Candidatus Peregrinibacteria bacterium]
MQKTSLTEMAVPVFRQLFNEMIAPDKIEVIGARHHSGLGAPPKVSLADLVMGAVYHELMGVGTKAEHLGEVSGVKITDASLSERYQGLDVKVFNEVMSATLKPLAELKLDPDAFFDGLLLNGVDGGTLSMANTPAVNEEREKTKTRRGKAAFAKLAFCTVFELGHHHPILAAIDGASEMELAGQLWSSLPYSSLTLGDRYYGNGKCISKLIAVAPKVGKHHFLFRVQDRLKSRILQKLADGSALVEITSTEGMVSQVREIRGKITTRTGRKVRVRMWTSLTDARRHTARKLLKLYSLRWEHEIGYDELKNQLHRGELLRSHTPHTAVQELAALIIAQAVIARIRRRVGHQVQLPALRVSFRKTHRLLQAFWTMVQISDSILSKKQIHAMGQKLMNHLEKQITPPRRKRSCPRALRQPVSKWPRLRKNSQAKGEILYRVATV